jgi:hypothetical protein
VTGGASAPDIRAATSGRTDFEGFRHDQLLDMVRHADPEALARVGDHLGLAVGTIARIGTELHRHTAGVAWEGASGAAFREWGRSIAGATLGLSDCARSTAAALTHAADTLRTVARDMPPVPAAARSTCAALQADPRTRNDPDAVSLLARAHAEVEAARLEAADQMRKLAQSYSLSATVIGAAEPPGCPPTPSQFVPPTRTRPSTTGDPDVVPEARGRSGSPAGRGVEADTSAADHLQRREPGAEAPPVTRTQSTGAPAQPDRHGGVGHGDGPGTRPPAPHAGSAAQQFAGGPFPYAASRDVRPHGTAAQPPRTIPRQTLQKVPYQQAAPTPSPARGGQGHGIVGGGLTGGPGALGGKAPGPAAYGVVGSYGPAARPPVVGTQDTRASASGRAAAGRSSTHRLAGESGGVVGRTSAAEFAPRTPGSAREPVRRTHLADEGRSPRDGAVPPVIQ